MPFFSIIIGVYNIGKYFESGINQLLGQTFDNYEIILVDDGSTDNCSYLCDKWSQKDSRIITVHKDNGGLGSARNAGFEIARGQYIWSFDLDDMLDSDTLERLYLYALETSAEVICFGYTEHNVLYGTSVSFEFKRLSCFSNEEVRSIYVDHLLGSKFNNGFFWNKLYSRAFIEKNHLRFGNEFIQQDELFNIKVFSCVNHLELIPGFYYHYYVYNSGNNRSRYIANRFEIIAKVRNEFLELYSSWNLNDRKMLVYVYQRFFNDILVVLNYNLFHPDSNFSFIQRKIKVKEIFSHELTRDCISRMDELNIIPHDFYKKGNYLAINRQSFVFFIFIHYTNFIIMNVLRRIRFFIKRPS